MEIKSTKEHANEKINMLVYGPSGAGKTTLIKTLPHPIVLSAEGGLLSLSSEDIPYIEVRSIEDLREAYTWLFSSSESSIYESVSLDSISEIGEVVLAQMLRTHRDGRAAYGELASTMTTMIRMFRDLPGRHVYFTAKMERKEDEEGRNIQAPSMPGTRLTNGLSYFFDQVFKLEVSPADEDGVSHRRLLCAPTNVEAAKDRSGKLDKYEPADLGHIISKIKEN